MCDGNTKAGLDGVELLQLEVVELESKCEELRPNPRAADEPPAKKTTTLDLCGDPIKTSITNWDSCESLAAYAIFSCHEVLSDSKMAKERKPSCFQWHYILHLLSLGLVFAALRSKNHTWRS